MRIAMATLLSCLLLIPAAALAEVDGANFDDLPLGEYQGPARVLNGDGSCVQVRPADSPTGGAPIPGDGLGNMLCIDAIEKTQPIIIEFDFWCEPQAQSTCQLKYGFSGSAWALSGGFEVHVDADGVYDNADDQWDPLIGIPPSTTQGSNTENEGACDFSFHTVTFIVKPGSIMYIDDLRTECMQGSVPVEEHSWGAMKSIFGE